MIAPRGFDGVLRASYAPAQDIGRRNREEESGLLTENGKGRRDKRVYREREERMDIKEREEFLLLLFSFVYS